MTGLERETPPAVNRGRGEGTEHDPCKITGSIRGNDCPRYGEALLPGGVVPHSTGDAVQFLVGWAPEGPWVLTSIVPDGRTTTETFTPATLAQMRDWIEARQGRQNIYFTVNALARPMEVKPKKTDIRGMRAVHVDVDARAGEDADACWLPFGSARARAAA